MGNDKTKYDKIFEEAKNGGRYAGTYNDAIKKTPTQLNKSIGSHEDQATEHQAKINNPKKYVSDWEIKNENYKTGTIKTWEKHRAKNKDEAEIEKRVRKERGLE